MGSRGQVKLLDKSIANNLCYSCANAINSAVSNEALAVVELFGTVNRQQASLL